MIIILFKHSKTQLNKSFKVMDGLVKLELHF